MRNIKNPSKSAIGVLRWLLMLIAAVGLSCNRETPQTEGGTPASDKTSAAESIAEADRLYSQREDLSKVRLAVTLLRQARISDYGNYEAAWKLARAGYYLGAHSTDAREQDEAFREGIEAGKSAVQLEGNRPDGHFWLGAAYGGAAEHSTLAGLSSIEDIRREMDAVLKIDEGYQSGSAYLGLGQLYLQAPRLLGGDYQKAIEYLEEGLKFGSNNALLRLRLAEAYEAANRDRDARKEIDFILNMTPNPEYMAEQKEAVEKGKQLLEKMDRK